MNKILLIAGEISADHHGAALVREIQAQAPNLQFFGIGGDALAAEKMELLVHLKRMAFLGIGEVLRHLPYIRRVRRKILQRAAQEKPLCAILIDYPGFNLRLAPALKKMGIPVIYYISPQVWAWGKRRVRKIKNYVDKMLVLFPFEQKFYAGYGFKAVYVGHPIVDHHAAWLPKQNKTFDPQQAVLGLLPGSRKQEVKNLLPEMVHSADLLFRRNKISRAEILRVAHIEPSVYGQAIAGREHFISLSRRPIYEALPAYDAALVASGTATLEVGYFKVPMIVVYKVNPLTYWLARRLVRIEHIGLVNIVAERELVKELIQNRFTAQNAAQALTELLIPEKHAQAQKVLHVIEEKLGQPGASQRAAEEVLKLIKQKYPQLATAN